MGALVASDPALLMPSAWQERRPVRRPLWWGR